MRLNLSFSGLCAAFLGVAMMSQPCRADGPLLQENFDEVQADAVSATKSFGKEWDLGGLWRVFDPENGPFLATENARSAPNCVEVQKKSPICMVVFDRNLQTGKAEFGFSARLDGWESGLDVVISDKQRTGGPNPIRTLAFQIAPGTHEFRLPLGRGAEGSNFFVSENGWEDFVIEIDFDRAEFVAFHAQDGSRKEIGRGALTGEMPTVNAIRFAAMGKQAEARAWIDDVWIKTAENTQAANIGSRRELFVDDALVAEMKNLDLRVQHPVEREVAMEFNAPWEGNISAYVTVFEDGGKYRMYYRGANVGDVKKIKATMSKEYTCYAESTDGIHWTRPEVGQVEFQGSRANNIVWAGPGAHNFAPFKDGNPKEAQGFPYKAVASAGETLEAEKAGGFLYAFGSKDGVHWQLLSEKPVMEYGAFDSHNVAFWDSEKGIYREYHRGFRGVRSVMYSTSKDFLNWEYPGWLSYEKDTPQEHLYTNAIQQYPRAPHLLIGFPTRFVPDRKKLDHPIGGISDTLFMVSRNGTEFRRHEEALLRPGARPERWLSRNNMMAQGMLFLPPAEGDQEEISLYATENFYNTAGQGTRLRRYTLRLDGFVSLHGGSKEGELLTKPLIFAGKDLFLNYATSAAGTVEVELTDEEGKALEGFSRQDVTPLFGDSTDEAVRWKGTLSALQGKPIRLRFYLKDADLYAFQFR